MSPKPNEGVAQARAILGVLAQKGVKPKRFAARVEEVRPGDVFLAIAGNKHDPRLRLDEAVVNGAQAVLWEKGDAFCAPALAVPSLGVEGLRPLLGFLAQALSPLPPGFSVIAVTGTNGKTTLSWLLAQMGKRLGTPLGYVGTLGSGFPGEDIVPTGMTTPDALRLHDLLVSFAQRGACGAAVEASSHALDQGRLLGLAVQGAVFTNLTRDHLDYHLSLFAYARAKARIFSLDGLEFAAVNVSDPFGERMAARLKKKNFRLFTYGMDKGEIKADAPTLEKDTKGVPRMVFGVSTPWGKSKIRVHGIGAFNALNALGALSAALGLGFGLQDACLALEEATLPPGRMTLLQEKEKPLVAIDYAHTPSALRQALLALRQLQPQGKLICVFGAGGERDRGKRPEMGKAAGELADVVIITSDNPRGEDPLEIMGDIERGMEKGKPHLVPDRREALFLALALARPEDKVLIAGKGHEGTQEIKGVQLHFSDIEVARGALGQ